MTNQNPLIDDIVEIDGPVALAAIAPTITALNHEFHPGLIDAAELTPLSARDRYQYRQQLAAKAPGLAGFAQKVRNLLWQGAMAILVREMGLAALSPGERRHILFGLSNLIGNPSATDPHVRKVLWDVKARNVGGEYFATFSEHDGEAEFHTDTQYYPQPERYFLLYVMRAARCGGGLNRLASGPKILARLSRTPEGKESIRLLASTSIPFRIPSAFARTAAPEFTHATAIGDTPLLRYRLDTIRNGREHFPDARWDELEEALDMFANAANEVATHPFFLPDDAAVFVNNHETLHARTAFKDSERHLIRIRMHS